MQLSEHFRREEFELESPMPEECLPAFTALCETLLEPIRAHFDAPEIITSGYRSVAGNVAAHGNEHSEHVATANWCAADWFIAKYQTDMRPVFDWIREQPHLAFHHLTLEHAKNDDIIHLSWNKENNSRIAKEGAVNNLTAYTNWPVVGFNTDTVEA